MPNAFSIKDCALIAIATGERAHDLRELRDRLETTHSGCIYYHFWGGLLRPRFDDPQYPNDFAIWVRHSLYDPVLAERLAILDPKDFGDMEPLRRELLDLMEQRLYEKGAMAWLPARAPFHFVKSQIVVFDTQVCIHTPLELKTALPHLSYGSVFYHFIDARNRTQRGKDDFSAWLLSLGEEHRSLAQRIAAIDPYFTSLGDLRREICAVFEDHVL